MLRHEGAEFFVSAAGWWPGEWGPNGEWEQRTLENDIPLIVCNRTGVDNELDVRAAETVVADRGQRLLSLSEGHSTMFLVELSFRNGHGGHHER
jgi:hypothetical protein